MTIRIVFDDGADEWLANQLEPEMDKIADAILEEMKENVPVDTGALRDSLDVERDGNIWRVGTPDINYGAAVENGHGNIPPTHFMRNATYKNRPIG